MRVLLLFTLISIYACGLGLVGGTHDGVPTSPEDEVDGQVPVAPPTERDATDSGRMLADAKADGGCPALGSEPVTSGERSAVALRSLKPKSLDGGAAQFGDCHSFVVR